MLRPGGVLALLDEFPFEQFVALLDELPMVVMDWRERGLGVRWNRQVAERAIALYAEGRVTQTRAADRMAQEQTRIEVHSRMAEVERQLDAQGHYVPFGLVRGMVAQKIRDGKQGHER